MIKKIIEDFKISRLTYYLEIIKNKDLPKKVKAFKNIDNMKISKKMGLLILRYAKYDYGIVDGNGGINSSLISLCTKNYYDEYTLEIKNLFKTLDEDAKDKTLFLLSSVDNESALNLYVDLILKYYENKKEIPISNLYERTNSYNYLFPKLYKAIKFNNSRNNILVLINDYLNAGVIPEKDLKKNKKLLTDAICKLFNEALKYKFTTTFNGLKQDDYINLRYYLEIAINIETYISSKKTNDLLIKLLKKHDNQLKIFILENFQRKGKKIDNIMLSEIAKDDASRYALYEYLSIYERLDLFPKKYLNGKEIAKSDLILSILKNNAYTQLPKYVKFIKTKEFNNHLYYIFTYKYTYINNLNFDETTNYILKETGLNKYNNKEVKGTFVGISGGYNLEKETSLVESRNSDLMVSLKNESETIDEVVGKILLPFTKQLLQKININKKDKKEIKKLKEEKQELVFEEEVEEEVRRSKFRFWYILLFLFIVLLGTIGVMIYVINNPELTSKTINRVPIFKSSSLVHSDEFKEINGSEIYSREHQSYYVLLFKKPNGKSKYYTYIDTLIDNGYKIYYVDLNNENNAFLYGQNDLNFTVTRDRFLKVEDGDFSFYVDGKNNILNELKSYVDEIEKKEEEELKKQQDEEKKHKEEQKSK